MKNNLYVDYQLLGDVCLIQRGKSISKKTIANNPGDFPVISAGVDPLGFVNQYNTEDPLGVTGSGSIGNITWCEGRYFRASHNFTCKPKIPDHLSQRYLYHLLHEMREDLLKGAFHSGIPRLNKSVLAKLTIPIPSFEKQQEIVLHLDQITKLEAELEAELEARKSQYLYIRKSLLDFLDDSVQMHALGEICHIKAGQNMSKKEIENNPGPFPVIGSGFQPLGHVGKWNTENDPLGITLSGNPGVTTWQENRYYRTNVNYSCTVIDQDLVLDRYLFYLLGEKHSKLETLAYGAIRIIRVGHLRSFEVPIPLLSVQKHIVATLDPLHRLVHDISGGIPGEIALRKQQLQWFRSQCFAPLLDGLKDNQQELVAADQQRQAKDPQPNEFNHQEAV